MAFINRLTQPITTLLIDLDDTVYPSDSGVWDQISLRMETYMIERIHIPPQDVTRLRRELYRQYGTTLRGMQMMLHIDEREFLAFVHDVPVESMLTPDPALREVLLRYPQRKFIFTNADRRHAERVLKHMQLADCFDGIIDILDIAPYCKPMPESFKIALGMAGASDPQECIFIDDALHNLTGARAMGLHAIQVNCQPPQASLAQEESSDIPRIPSLAQLPTILPLPC